MTTIFQVIAARNGITGTCRPPSPSPHGETRTTTTTTADALIDARAAYSDHTAAASALHGLARALLLDPTRTPVLPPTRRREA